MYLHLGQETLVKSDDIIGLFDMDKTTISKHTRSFLNNAEKRKQVVSVTYDLPKTFVVISPKKSTKMKRKRRIAKQKLQKNETLTIYLSQISTATLKKRSGNASAWSNNSLSDH